MRGPAPAPAPVPARRAGGCGAAGRCRPPARRPPRVAAAPARARSPAPRPPDEDPEGAGSTFIMARWRGRVPRCGADGRRCALLVAATGTAAQQRERPAPDGAGRVDLLAALEALHGRARERSEQAIHRSRPGTGPLQAPLDLTDALRPGRAAEARPERDRARGPSGRPAAAGGRGVWTRCSAAAAGASASMAITATSSKSGPRIPRDRGVHPSSFPSSRALVSRARRRSAGQGHREGCLSPVARGGRRGAPTARRPARGGSG